jgi:hypothetical protein
MIGILLMLLAATIAMLLGQNAVDALLSRRVRIPVRSPRAAEQTNSAGHAE